METARARELLDAQRQELTQLLASTGAEARGDRESEDEQGVNVDDPAQPLTAEGVSDAVSESLRDRLAAIDRAEARLDAGTYGRSILSDEPIPDARLEAEPTAELTVEEQGAQERADR